MSNIIYKHPDDKPLMGSLGDYHTFKKHVCWLDLSNWIEERIDMISKSLETAENMEEVRGYQESLKHLRDILDLPDLFIEELETEQEQNKEDKDE